MTLSIQESTSGKRNVGFGAFFAAAISLVSVAFLVFTLAPTFVPEDTSALSGNATMSVGVDESLSLRIVEYDGESEEWVDTNELSTNVVHGDFASAAVRVIASTNGLGGIYFESE